MSRLLAVCHPAGGTCGVFHDAARAVGAVIDEWLPAEHPEPPRPLGDYAALVVLGGDQNVSEQDRYPYLTAELVLLREWLAGGRPVLGVCVGMQALFEGSTEPALTAQPGLGQWPGTVERLTAAVVPHMGWSPVSVGAGSRLFAGVEHERFYFVHSYAVRSWTLAPYGPFVAVTPVVTWADHGGPFVAAVENGPLAATQFHPEKSGDAGAHLLESWVRSL